MKFKRQEMPDGTVQMVRDEDVDMSYVGRGEAPASVIDLLRADPQAEALLEVAAAINRLADAYLYVNQPEDEPSFEGQSLSDREHL